MDEAVQLCDRLVVMDGAKIVAEGSPHALIRRYATREVLELRLVPGEGHGHVGTLAGIGGRIEELPDRLLVYTDNGDRALGEVNRRDVVTTSALVRRSTLGDVFLRLTGRTLVD